MSDYKWDLFVSYRRTENVREWTVNHLVPRLTRCLEDHLPREPGVFIDKSIAPGDEWPEALGEALQQSRILLAVWSPQYFTSDWCLAEWHTFMERERLLRLEGVVKSSPLIYPVRFSDGDSFPPEARNVQHETVLSRFTIPDRQFADTLEYIEFHREVQKLAEVIAARVVDAPPWQPDWPTRRPNPPNARRIRLPRL